MATPLPLKILTTTQLAATEELIADAQKGHAIHTDDSLLEYDIILSPNAFRVRGDLLKYRELAYKESRAMKRAVKSRKKKETK